MIVALSPQKSLGRPTGVDTPACALHMLSTPKFNLRFIRSVRLSRGIDSAYFHLENTLRHRLLWIEDAIGSNDSIIPKKMANSNPITEQQVRSALKEGTLTEEQATLLRDWLDEDEGGRADLYTEVSALLTQIQSSSLTNTSLGTNVDLKGFSQAELTVLLPLLTDKDRSLYSDWNAARTATRKAKIAESLLPALTNARDQHVRLEQRKRVLKGAWDTCTLNLANLSDQEINLLRGILPREETEELLQMAILAQTRQTAIHIALRSFHNLRPNTFGRFFRYRTDAEILEALEGGFTDPLSIPPQRGFYRFLWRLRGWGK
jgi:hypothetical protein